MKNPSELSVCQTLMLAQELIRDKSRWGKGTFVKKTATGFKYCAVGALRQVNYFDIDRAVMQLNNAANTLGYTCIVYVNDTQRHADVMQCFDLAIAKTRELAI